MSFMENQVLGLQKSALRTTDKPVKSFSPLDIGSGRVCSLPIAIEIRPLSMESPGGIAEYLSFFDEKCRFKKAILFVIS